MTNKEAIDELSVLSERISDGETVNVFVHDGKYGQALDLAIKALEFIDENFPNTFIDYLNGIKM